MGGPGSGRRPGGGRGIKKGSKVNNKNWKVTDKKVKELQDRFGINKKQATHMAKYGHA